MTKEFEGYGWGSLGVLGFGLTLPATKAAVPLLGFVTVGLGRAVIAGFLSLALLILTKSVNPTLKQWCRLGVVALGVVFGFPFLSAYAMQYVPASHGAIVVAILPLLTALCGVFLAKEKPSRGYWIAGIIGSVTIVVYSVAISGGVLHLADVALLLAAASAAIGYAEGARLASELSSWRVICYALVMALPVTIVASVSSFHLNSVGDPFSAWLGFIYVSFISMFLAFFAWYQGLALGGIAKIGQLQLLQPFVTIFASAWFFREKLDGGMFVVLAIVLLSVHFGRKAKVIRA